MPDAADVGRASSPVADEVDLRRRRRDAFVERRAAEQRVDERALAGVELADDDQEEQLVELAHRLGERGRVGAVAGTDASSTCRSASIRRAAVSC